MAAAPRRLALVLVTLLALGPTACGALRPDPSTGPAAPGPSESVSRPATERPSGAAEIAGRIVVSHPSPDMAIDPGNELYTSDHGTVTITDIGRAELGEFPQESIEIGVRSGGLALDPHASLLYAGTQDSRGRGAVTVLTVDRRLDPRTGEQGQFKVVDTISLGSTYRPYRLALDPAAQVLFVLTDQLHVVLVIDTRSRKVTTSLPVGSRDSEGHEVGGLGLDVDTRAGTAIISGTEQSWVIDTTSLRMRSVRTGGGGPVTVDATTGRAFIPDEAAGTVTVVDTSSGQTVRTIQVGFHSSTGAVAVNPTLRRAYLPVAQEGMLAVLNTETLETVEKIPPPAGSRSWGEVVVDTSTNLLYAADGGSVLVITDL